MVCESDLPSIRGVVPVLDRRPGPGLDLVELAVNFGSDQNNQAAQVNPDHEDHKRTECAVRPVVGGNMSGIEVETERNWNPG